MSKSPYQPQKLPPRQPIYLQGPLLPLSPASAYDLSTGPRLYNPLKSRGPSPYEPLKRGCRR